MRRLNLLGRIRMGWPNHLGRLREYFGRVTLAESENALAVAYALVAAVRNLAYQSASSSPWCVRWLGTCPAWLGSRLGAHRWSHPFCKLTESFWSFNSDQKMVSTASPLYSFLRNRSEAKTKTPILSENHLSLKPKANFFFFLDFYFKTKNFLYLPSCEGVSILPHEGV